MKYLLQYKNNTVQLQVGSVVMDEFKILPQPNEKMTHMLAIIHGVYLALKHKVLVFSMQGWSDKLASSVDAWFGKSFPLKFKYCDKGTEFWCSHAQEIVAELTATSSLQFSQSVKKIEEWIIFLFAGVQRIFINNPDAILLTIELSKISYGQYISKKPLIEQLWDYNLFSDASVRERERITTVATFISDKNHTMLAGYRHRMDYTEFADNNHAEIYAIGKGLELAAQMGIKKLRLFTDSLCAVEKLQKYTPSYQGHFYEAIRQVVENTQAFDLCEVVHIKRHHNSIADELTHFK